MPGDYQIGIEEEYFVVDLRTRNVRAVMPKKFYRTAKALLRDRHARTILAHGSSAHQQVHVYSQARIAGRSRSKALKDVVGFLLATTVLRDDKAAIAQTNRLSRLVE